MKFYISDLHFGHKNILAFDSRPFFTLAEMEKVLIGNWNAAVDRNDEVYILGDMFWHNEDAPRILSALNGRKYLIQGNHDRVNAQMNPFFEWVKPYVTVKDEDQKIVLCHYPIAHWEGQDHTPPVYHFYGHVHKGRDTRMFDAYAMFYQYYMHKPFFAANVGCMVDYMGYTPRTLNEIKQAKRWTF